MMRWIVRSSLQFRFIVVALAVGMMALGATRVRDMPVDVFPEFAPPFVEVQTEGLGMSTEEVEQLITIPMEQSLNSTPDLDVMRSKTVPGLSSITLFFKRGTDSLEARQLVNERVAIAIPSLPASAGIPWVLQPLSATSRALKIGLTTDRYSLTDLSMIAYWTIRWRLMAVPGVANVNVWGDRWKQLQLQFDPEKLRAHRVSVDYAQSVASDALDFGLLKYTDAAKNRVGGFIDTPNQRLGIHHVLPVFTPASMDRISIPGRFKRDGTALTLGDLGNMTWGHQPLFGDAVINDKQGLMLVVEKFPWANTLDVTRGIDRAIDEMRPGLPGIQMDTHIFRPATFIEISISNLTDTLLLGTLLVVVVLVAFLFEWRAAVISLAAIPLSLMAAALVLYLRGETINTMVLAGFVISVGVVVDDAIIDIENIVRRLRQNRAAGHPTSVMSVVLEASLEVRRAIVYATLIIVLAVIPVFFIQSVSGAFFKPLVLSYGLAVLASMVVALTVTPALALLLLGRAPLKEQQPPLVRLLQRGYTALLRRVIRRPSVVIVATAATLVAGLAVLPYTGESLFPTFKERDFLALWVTRPSTGHQEIVRITERASHDFRAIPGVRGFGAHIGRAVQGEEINGINFAEDWLSLDPKANYNQTLDQIRATVDAYPGLFREQTTYLNERIDEVLAGSSEAITVRIFGPNLDTLRDEAAAVHHALKGIKGVIDLRTRAPGRRPLHPGRAQPAQVGALRAETGRHPPPGGHHRGQRGGLRPARERQGVRRDGVERAEGAQGRAEHPRPAPRHAGRGSRPPLRRRQGLHRLDPEPDLARGQLPPHRRRHEREGPRPGLGRRRREEPAGEGEDAARVPLRGAGRVRRARGRPGAPVHVRPRGGDRDLPAPADLHRQLAGGDVLVPDAAAGVGRRPAGGVRGGRRDLARLAGRVPDRVRHRRPQRDPARSTTTSISSARRAGSSASTSSCRAPASGWRRS